jgi:hypothetical protein
MSQSIFDSHVDVNNNTAAITIVFKGNHAGLIIETLRNDNNSREVRFAHFLPCDIEYGNNSFRRTAITLGELAATPRPGRVDQRVLHGINNHAEFLANMEGYESNRYRSSTYRVTGENFQNLRPMVERIIAQFNGDVPVSEFHIRGIAHGNGTSRNCRSWVRDTVSEVGININRSWWDTTCSDTLDSDNTSSDTSGICNVL